MSAFISIIRPSACFLFTDGASYDSAGVVRSINRKVRRAIGQPFAVTSRGNAALGDKVMAFMCETVEKYGVDAFISECLPEMLDEMKEQQLGCMMTEEKALEIHIAAWSETDGPMHTAFQTIDYPDSPDMPAFALHGLPAVSIAGPKPLQALMQISRQDASLPEAVQIEKTAVKLMDAMRQKPEEIYGLNAQIGTCYIVGGHIDMTTVTATGTTVRRVHVWDDKIGTQLVPQASPATVTAFSSMNRRQRRASEKERRLSR